MIRTNHCDLGEVGLRLHRECKRMNKAAALGDQIVHGREQPAGGGGKMHTPSVSPWIAQESAGRLCCCLLATAVRKVERVLLHAECVWGEPSDAEGSENEYYGSERIPFYGGGGTVLH